MSETYKFADEPVKRPVEPDDTERQIKIIRTVEQEETFTIKGLENQLQQLNNQIKQIEVRKTELKAKIKAAKTALNIT